MTRRAKTHIWLGIRSVSPSDQSPRYPHKEILDPYLPVAKFRGISPQHLMECLREMSRSFSANFCGVSPRKFAEKTLGDTSDFYFSPRKKKNISRKGCTAAKRERKVFCLGLICMRLIKRQVFMIPIFNLYRKELIEYPEKALMTSQVWNSLKLVEFTNHLQPNMICLKENSVFALKYFSFDL